ncbi:Type I restriction modification DNA specificity domain protein [Serratia marcescens]|uniref:Type I restriction modification DNA specificity domain protein n=2 Tax=Serratia marcescens TaxID=615 RepID=A0A656VQW6_SERMA|nr:Type I restriction modification DNA specificity domain protein [Serratia marcescens]
MGVMDTIIEIQSERTVPVGYKHTELGITPEDWDVSPLAKHTLFVGSGKTNTKSKGSFPLFGSTGQIGSCLNPEYDGDAILIARVGANAGKLSFVSGQYGVSDNTLIVKLKPQNNIHFYKYWLIFKNLNSLVFGSGQPLITGTQLKELSLPIPSINEQTAIANVLSDTDALISKIEQLIAKKQAIKTATMQQLLTGRTRLPQFAKHPDGTLKGHRSSELGSIPDNWQVVPFKDVLTIKHGKNQKEVESPSGQYPIYATGGQIGNATSFLFDKPSVLIGRKGTIDKPKYADTPFWTVDTLFYSEIKKNVCVKFIYYKFCMIDWMQYNEASGVPSLNAHTIENVLVALPNMEEQTAIATILSDMDAELEALEQKLSKARDIKQGMMQQLLTGRIRLPLDQQP